jgi:hypothetical protein
MHTPEWHEKQKIKKYLASIPMWYFMPYMAGRGKAGVPDIIACLNGKFIGIEVKRPGKFPTPIQCGVLQRIRLAGGFVCWGDADHVIDAINTHFGHV